MDALSISEGRKRLFELRDRVVSNHDQIILTHKMGNMVLISMDEWESYQETLLLLRDKETIKALVRSFEDHDMEKSNGKGIEEVFSDLP